jgi:hypothetical protein
MAPENSHLLEKSSPTEVRVHPLTYRLAPAEREDENLVQRKVRKNLLPYLVKDRLLGLGLADTQAPKHLEVKLADKRQVPAAYEKIYSPKTTPRSVTVSKRRLLHPIYVISDYCH